MQKIKLFATLLTVALCTTVFVSCNTGGCGSANVIEIRNAVNVSDNIVTVGTAISSRIDDENFTVAVGEWTDSGVTLTLSNEIPEAFLRPVLESDFRHFSFSDERANIAVVAAPFWALDRHYNVIGSFLINEIIGNKRYSAAWIYADRRVNITGANEGINVDINLRQGWNILYTHHSLFGDGDVIMTTRRPSGMNFEWTFISGDNSVRTIEIGNIVNLPSDSRITVFNRDLIASANWGSNGAVLELPHTMRSSDLIRVADIFGFGSDALIVSNPNARILNLDDRLMIGAFDINDGELGFFELADNEKGVEVGWIFADRDVDIMGGEPGVIYFELLLNRGWNMVYAYQDVNGVSIFLTQRPSGINLEWNFFPSED